MDYGKSFTYVFEDKDWLKKVAIGGLLMLVPILNLIGVGYGLRTLKAVGEGKEKPLPEWDDFGGDLVKGLLLVVAQLIYALPAIIGSVLGGVVMAVLSGESGDLTGGAAVCFTGVQCLAGLWGLLVAVFFPAALIRYAEKGDFSAFFRFGEIWAVIKDNLGDYIVVLLLALVAGMIAGFGTIACVIGVIFTAFWAVLIEMHLFGQILAKMAPSAPASPFSSGPSYGDLNSGSLSSKTPSGQQ
jgi:hypothetical protein